MMDAISLGTEPFRLIKSRGNILNKCFICNSINVKLTQKVHVIPRFLILDTKGNNGRNVQVVKGKGVNEKAQRDVKGYFWCAKCEKYFKKEDDFAKDFFHHDKGFNGIIAKLDNFQFEQYEIEVIKSLFRYAVGIILRYQVALIVNKETLLNINISKLLKILADRENIFHNIDLYIEKLVSRGQSREAFKYFEYPFNSNYNERNTIEFMIRGYRFVLFIEKYPCLDFKFSKILSFVKSGKVVSCPFDESGKFSTILKFIGSELGRKV